jgi:hypothetical protein
MPESQSIIHLKSPFPYTAKPAQSIWHCIFEDEPDVLGSGARSDEDEVFYDPVTLERISFGALREQTKRVAHGLLNGLGLKEGDTVMVFSWNCIQYPSILLGTQAAKLVFTGGNPTYSASDLAYHISNSKARVVLCDKASAEITKQAVKDAKLGNSVRVLAITPYDLPGIRSVWSYITDEKLEPRAFKKGEEDSCAFMSALPCPPAVLYSLLRSCYSSGTTGRPKGCIITHQMIWTSQHIFPASWPHSLHESEWPDVSIGMDLTIRSHHRHPPALPNVLVHAARTACAANFSPDGLYWLALKGVKWVGSSRTGRRKLSWRYSTVAPSCSPNSNPTFTARPSRNTGLTSCTLSRPSSSSSCSRRSSRSTTSQASSMLFRAQLPSVSSSTKLSRRGSTARCCRATVSGTPSGAGLSYVEEV